jgi:pimeloyl-ACP methyl ester carboxylesterase
MKNTSIIFLLLLTCLAGRGQMQQTSFSASNSLPPENAERTPQDFFSQDEYEWFLITPDHVPLYVLEAGHGPNVFVLHGGFGMEHSYMRTFLKPFEQDYHMIYYDQRGSLRSPVPKHDFKKYITMDNMVDDLELLRKETGEEKITLLAHSMGAVLAYEYMRKYPDQVGNVIIISGFAPKFPTSKATFYEMFLSQQEREAFKHREAVQAEIAELKATADTSSKAFLYLQWKIRYSACQIYNIEKWQQIEGGLGFFNGKMNKLIGPESHIPLSYGLKFLRYQRQFNQGKLDSTVDDHEIESPVDYLPIIQNHPHPISYLLGQYEVGDFNLRSYHRYLGEMEGVDLHIFDKACHNVWMDQPEAFARVLTTCLAKESTIK